MPYTAHVVLELNNSADPLHINQALRRLTDARLYALIERLHKGKTAPLFNDATPGSLRFANSFFRFMGHFFNQKEHIVCHFQKNGTELNHLRRHLTYRFARGHQVRQALGLLCVILLAPLILCCALVAGCALLLNLSYRNKTRMSRTLTRTAIPRSLSESEDATAISPTFVHSYNRSRSLSERMMTSNSVTALPTLGTANRRFTRSA